MAESVLAELDTHGRLAIPTALRTDAVSTTEAVLTGWYARLERWSPTRREASIAGLEHRHARDLGNIPDLP